MDPRRVRDPIILLPLFHVKRAFSYFTNRELYCNLVGLCVGMFVVLPLAYMLLAREEPMEIISVHAEPRVVVVDDMLTMHWTAKLRRPNCPGVVSRRFVDSIGRIIEFKPVPTRNVLDHLPTGIQEFTTKIEIPRGLAPGKVHYEPRIERWCNWVQRYVWPIQGPDINVPFTLIDNVIRQPLSPEQREGDLK